MATMSIRIPDEDKELLRQLAEKENRSMNDVVLLALRQLAAPGPTTKPERTRAAFARILDRDAEALDLLSR